MDFIFIGDFELAPSSKPMDFATTLVEKVLIYTKAYFWAEIPKGGLQRSSARDKEIKEGIYRVLVGHPRLKDVCSTMHRHLYEGLLGLLDNNAVRSVMAGHPATALHAWHSRPENFALVAVLSTSDTSKSPFFKSNMTNMWKVNQIQRPISGWSVEGRS